MDQQLQPLLGRPLGTRNYQRIQAAGLDIYDVINLLVAVLYACIDPGIDDD